MKDFKYLSMDGGAVAKEAKRKFHKLEWVEGGYKPGKNRSPNKNFGKILGQDRMQAYDVGLKLEN